MSPTWIPCSERLPERIASGGTFWGGEPSLPVITLFPDVIDHPAGLNIQAAYYVHYNDGDGAWFTPTDASGGLDRCSSHGGAVPIAWIPLPTTPKAAAND